MNRHPIGGLILGIVFFSLLPLSAGDSERRDMPWPALLSEPLSSEGFAMLQLRANMSLERLIRSAQTQASAAPTAPGGGNLASMMSEPALASF
jgi:hypothetical protein